MDYPTSAMEDRRWLEMELPEYNNLVQATMADSIIVSRTTYAIKSVSTAALRKHRAKIRNHAIHQHSMIFKEIDRRVTAKINQRMGKKVRS